MISTDDVATATLKYGSSALLVLAAFLGTFAIVASPDSLLGRYWARYAVSLESKLQRMYIWTSGTVIAVAQVVGIVASLGMALAFKLPAWVVVALLATLAFGPMLWIERMRQERVRAIEAQTDGFLVAMANALKSTPSIGDAFKSVAGLVRDPLRQEIATALKEIRFGATLDQALGLMAARVGSSQFDSALSCILIGRQVGGNLPKILDSTAGSLREMSRLEGVVRTKTADGKMQAWVLAVMPLFMVFALSMATPGYFDPMTKTAIGLALTAVAVLFWAGSIITARKVLSVDL
jgi:tight adherence protein B